MKKTKRLEVRFSNGNFTAFPKVKIDSIISRSYCADLHIIPRDTILNFEYGESGKCIATVYFDKVDFFEWIDEEEEEES